MSLPPGARVRCAYRGEHLGTLLAIDDPLAWQGSIAFSHIDGVPPPELVRAHVERCTTNGSLRDGKRPVLWDFGTIHWDSQLEVTR